MRLPQSLCLRQARKTEPGYGLPAGLSFCNQNDAPKIAAAMSVRLYDVRYA